jgi:hypothetical protein
MDPPVESESKPPPLARLVKLVKNFIILNFRSWIGLPDLGPLSLRR